MVSNFHACFTRYIVTEPFYKNWYTSAVVMILEQVSKHVIQLIMQERECPTQLVLAAAHKGKIFGAIKELEEENNPVVIILKCES